MPVTTFRPVVRDYQILVGMLGRVGDGVIAALIAERRSTATTHEIVLSNCPSDGVFAEITFTQGGVASTVTLPILFTIPVPITAQPSRSPMSTAAAAIDILAIPTTAVIEHFELLDADDHLVGRGPRLGPI